MHVVRTIAEVRECVADARRGGRPIGLVPTMGALHAGHTSLIEAARRDGCCVVVSIFVNPTQFAPHEDFNRYPRDEAGDLRACGEAGADIVFLPSAAEVYPAGAVTTVHVARLTETLCGPYRPGHFDGVCTVVCKLLNMVQPDRAYFGRKDAQQLTVVRRMVRDLDVRVEVVGCPTVREPDGLAMSSRNRYLAPADRAAALGCSRALRHAEARVAAGERDSATIIGEMRALLGGAGVTRIDYVSIVDAASLQPAPRVEGAALIAIAAYVGGTRLIDNVTVGEKTG